MLTKTFLNIKNGETLEVAHILVSNEFLFPLCLLVLQLIITYPHVRPGSINTFYGFALT